MKKVASVKTIIRPIALEEVPQFLQLFKETVVSVPDYSPRLRKLFLHKYRRPIVEKRIRDQAALCLVAVREGQLAGFIWGMAPRPTDDGVYWVNWIGVRAADRKTGVATALGAELIRILKKNKFHKIWFNIDPKNLVSQKTLKALGCTFVVRIKKHWYKNDALIWEKYIG